MTTWCTLTTASASSKACGRWLSKARPANSCFCGTPDDAKLYVPLARIDLVQKYQSLGGVKPTLDRLGTTIWEARKTRVRKSVNDMAEQLLALYAERKDGAPATRFRRIPTGSASSRMPLNSRKLRTSSAPSKM